MTSLTIPEPSGSPVPPDGWAILVSAAPESGTVKVCMAGKDGVAAPARAVQAMASMAAVTPERTAFLLLNLARPAISDEPDGSCGCYEFAVRCFVSGTCRTGGQSQRRQRAELRLETLVEGVGHPALHRRAI